MAILLGIDTGGTFTDAVLWDEQSASVLAKAKALTTKTDLSIGIGEAIQAVLQQGVASPGDVRLVSLSTTLATNALVEGHGGRAGLVFIGFDDSDVTRAGLAEALASDPLIRVTGGHDTGGQEFASLDLETLEAQARAAAPTLDAFAVVSRFATRNPAHERAARDALSRATGLPVTCGHELSDALNGPKRALTALLNARLIGMIADLIAAARAVCDGAGLDAPMMLVKGDGALVSADFAAERPIETILSGPAASLVGATALTGLRDAIVSDIGGTTTDIALLSDGLPRLSPRGATVGGFETMVAAVDMATHGLGGDSEVTLRINGLHTEVVLGPQKAMPLSLLVHTHPDLLETLEGQSRRDVPHDQDGRVALATGREPRVPLTGIEEGVFAALRAGPQPLETLCPTRQKLAAMDRLRKRGLVALATFTPTDAAHVLGTHGVWSTPAAHLGAGLFARKRDGKGERVAQDETGFAQMVL
ncbi:MAG: hydantoinase/oxoprolinase family protein, partial [Pseudomonadota bacterium]